jgi:hypothetical protein
VGVERLGVNVCGTVGVSDGEGGRVDDGEGKPLDGRDRCQRREDDLPLPSAPTLAMLAGADEFALPDTSAPASPARRNDFALPDTPAPARRNDFALPDTPAPARLPPQRYKVQFTASEEYVRLVAEARALLSHSSPRAGLDEIHWRAMRALVAKLERRKYAVTARPLQSARASSVAAPSAELRGAHERLGERRSTAEPALTLESGHTHERALEPGHTHALEPAHALKHILDEPLAPGGGSFASESRYALASGHALKHTPESRHAPESGHALKHTPESRYAPESGRHALASAETDEFERESASAREGAHDAGRGHPRWRRWRGRYISAEVRRAVFARDEGLCTYTSDSVQRCRETNGLELHHATAFAQGGEHRREKLTLRCRAHNGLAAEKDFGRAFVELARDSTGHEPWATPEVARDDWRP